MLLAGAGVGGVQARVDFDGAGSVAVEIDNRILDLDHAAALVLRCNVCGLANAENDERLPSSCSDYNHVFVHEVIVAMAMLFVWV